MYDPILRVLTVLEILQARDSVSGAELSQRLEVDLRTVQRYIVRLKDLGIPVQSTPGVGGAYRLRAGFRLPPLLFTNEEAFALSLGLRSLQYVGLESLAPATQGALSKLERVLPDPLRDNLHTVETAVTIEPSPWVVPAAAKHVMEAASAIRAHQRLRFQYESHTKAASERSIEPYAVLHFDHRWYLIGLCLSRKEVRTFRLDRVSQLEVRGGSFEPPSDFDAKAFLAARMPFVQSQHQIDVWIDMPEAEARSTFTLWRVGVEPDGQGTRLRCTRDRLELFAAMLLSMGRRIVVHNPPALRDVFRQLAAQAIQAAQDTSATE